MKNLLILFVLILLTSCSITERHYMPGYYVDFKKSYKIEPLSIKDTFPSTASTTKLITKSIIIYTDTITCDEIIQTDGSIIKGKVEEIGSYEIKYRDCDNLTGPLIDIENSKVFMIRYKNGKTTVITKVNNTPTATQTNNNNDVDIVDRVDPSQNHEYTPTQDEPKKTHSVAAIVIGIILLVAGLIVLILTSVVFGAILLALGILLIAI